MNYQEALEAAKKAGKLIRLSSNRLDMKEGDTIVGKYLSRDLVPSKKKGYEDSYLYHFDLDNGPADVFLSGHFDRTVGADLHEGCIYSIFYEGKTDIGENQTFKKYTVEEINLDLSETKEETTE